LYQREKSVLLIPFKNSVTLKDIKVGADYNYLLHNGLYGIAGAGYSSFEWLIIEDSIIRARENKGAIYFSLGAGYAMTEHFLAEFRFTHASYSGVGSSLGLNGKSFTAPAIAMSLLWRY
jgi:hypothetical protein